jgi:Mg-chelatase subunit ChlD
LIDWESFHFERIWPLGLGLGTAIILFGIWYLHRRTHFPDMTLITNTVSYRGVTDRLPVIMGGIILLLLMLTLMGPSLVRTVTVDQRARDYLVIVDTSRSMRHDANVSRDSVELRYERRAGTFSTNVDDPNSLPLLARYELARESLLSFLEQRKAQDRVGMIYFNDNVFTMSAPTANIDFVVEQLGSMDEYVNWGTDIALAMQSGLNLLERYPDQNKKAVILMTDAEAAYTKEVEEQLARIATMGISFYLLWITTDEKDMSNEEITAFLDYARTVGSVTTLETLDSRNLEDALRDIGMLEDYSYQEEKRQRLDLSQPFLDAARYLLLLWLLLVATIFHPGTTERNIFKRGNI